MSRPASSHADPSGGIVIVGAGLAAATAAEELRSQGFTGDLHMVAAERHSPYIRPPLSKEVLTGKAARETAFVHDDDWYPATGVDLIVGDAATAVDRDARRVTLATGRTLGYRRLLFATGAVPRRLDVPGADLDGIRSLRTLDDADILREELAGGGRSVVCIGSGWIGLEVTAAARGYGNTVTVVAPGAVPLASALGEELGGVFHDLHVENGVDFRMGTSVTAFEGDGSRVTGVRTDAGDTIAADLVIVGIGAAPAVEVARSAGLDVDDGIVVDAALRTSDPAVYAAGDVANAWHPTLGRRLRSEHWANAIGQGKAVAASMLGQQVSYDAVPYFYTDQYDLSMEYSGYFPLASGAEVVYRGNPATREFVAFWHRDGRVVAGMNVNVWDVNDDIAALVRSGRGVDVKRLADPSVPIGEL
ncbi:MAG: FAD-dependent oxidoreductase [Mycetocola sp.]